MPVSLGFPVLAAASAGVAPRSANCGHARDAVGHRL